MMAINTLFLLVLCWLLPVQSVAAGTEPFEGTWILNVAKSSFVEPVPPKGRTLTIRRVASDFLYSIETANADGSATRLRYTVPIHGGEGRFQEGPYDGVVHRRIDAFTREAKYLKAGKAVVSFTGHVSKDGRVLRIGASNGNAQSLDGQTVSVYDRR